MMKVWDKISFMAFKTEPRTASKQRVIVCFYFYSESIISKGTQ